MGLSSNVYFLEVLSIRHTGMISEARKQNTSKSKPNICLKIRVLGYTAKNFYQISETFSNKQPILLHPITTKTQYFYLPILLTPNIAKSRYY